MLIEILDGNDGWEIVQTLDREVYSPQFMATAIWRDVVWAHADKRVVVRDEGRVVCHAGLFFREGTLDGRPAKMCGIGGVMTAPAARKKGYASAAMRRAAEAMAGADFGLLFCEAHNVALYAGLCWRVFGGSVMCVQPSGPFLFDMMPTMILPLRAAPERGAVDLCGLPW
ncbi:MAG TPA: GNAT family N-acetyltransferase [Rhizomicrobium sp.]|nr:GNAT family N-acetyltransferase [Rhizomicrobium sp.]